MKNMMLFLCAVFLLPMALIGAEGTPIGGEPYASWEEGSSDYFVMFNSLIDDQMTLYGETTNHQGDTCLLESSFTLNNFHTPDDAIVAQAYLVWMGGVDPADFAMQTDNAVHLKFSRDDGYVWEEDVIVGDAARTLGDTTDPFLFQSVQLTTEVTTGCTETYPGQLDTADVAYFTYRTDITPFFQKIAEDNRAAEEPILDGTALYGAYTFSGLDCTDHDYYKCRTLMVSNWSILVVYRSEKVSNKKLYLYPGLAYMQGEATTALVVGFELPRNPFLRLTAMTAGGGAALTVPALPPEIIYLRGEGATSNYPLTNECNPLEGMSYEIYNSRSSVIGWYTDDESLYCVTGAAGGPDFFGIDADTFLLDSSDDVNLQEHLQLGGMSLEVMLSVNNDAILTNYLALSVDTRRAVFDIPPEASKWPYAREKHACSCRRDEDPADAWCEGRPMYYLIKVQNWGTNVANNVTVIDNLDSRVDYIAGSTEMADKFDANGNGTNWGSIPDKVGTGNAAFPLSGDGYKVAETMDVCNHATWTCEDTRLLRFKVKPKNILPNEIIPNSAIIKEAGSSQEYRTNDNFELNLYRGVCDELAVCPEPERLNCGGICSDPECNCCSPECDEDHPCPEFEVCDLTTYTCEMENPCTNTRVSYDIGVNSPDNESTIIIPADTEDLVVGQFKINGENCVQTRFYKFLSLRSKIEKDDANIQLTNIELIYDRNGSGSVESYEEVLATVPTPDSTGAYFVLDPSKNFFAGNEWHHFIVRTDVGYNGTQVPGGATFRFVIKDKKPFGFEDNGTPLADGDPIDFAEFAVEPTHGYFIVTKGPNDPPVPGPSENRSNVPMLQLRVKATDTPNKIKQITVSVPAAEEEYATFGYHLRTLSLYADTNGDGVPDGEPLAKLTSFDDQTEAVFEGDAVTAFLTLAAEEEKFLIISGDLSRLEIEERALIEIKRGSLSLETASPIEGLPIRSREFYFTEEYTPDYDIPDEDIPCCCGACGALF